MNEYIHVWKNAFNFDGRARRREYWLFVLINFIVSLVLGFIPIVGGIYALCVLIPGIAVAIRRLHDINRSGWWMLSPIVGAPFMFTGNLETLAVGGIIVGIISLVLVIFACLDGTVGTNRFGEDPKQRVAEATSQTIA